MITQRTAEQPASRNGYLCHGIVNTDASGVGLITVKGRDNSARITGFNGTPVNDTASAAKMYSAYIVSIAYSTTTRLTTITIQVNQLVDSGVGTTDITAYDGDVHFSFWVDDEPEGLPTVTVQTTNNTEEQAY